MELLTDLDTLEIPVAGYFGGVSNSYLDTLRGDYAYIITPGPFVKSLRRDGSAERSIAVGWDFELYPNPTQDGFYLNMPEGNPKDVVLFDLSGRQVLRQSQINDHVHFISTDQLAKGPYWIRVADESYQKVKKTHC